MRDKSLKGRLRALMTWRVMKRVLKWSTIISLALTALMAAVIAVTFWIYARDPKLPSVEKLKNYDPQQVTRIVVAGKDPQHPQLLGEIYTQRRTMVKYEDLPQLLVDAFVVAEDAGFWEHGGIDYKGMVRAFFVNLGSGKAKQGASTITQQVVKNLLLTPEKTFRRKMQEIILARRLESALTKQEILALYLNQIYFGHGRYGIVEAARYYFGDELKDLSPGEIAMLAGLPKGPEIYSPFKNRKLAEQRQEYVINQLVSHGKLDAAIAQQEINIPLPDKAHDAVASGVAPEIVDLVKKQLVADHGAAAMDTLGAEVYVTLRPDLQVAARTALQKQLRKYDAKHKVGVAIRSAKDSAAEIAKLKRKLPKGAPKAGEIYEAVITAVSDDDKQLDVDLGGVTGAVALTGDHEDRYNPEHEPPSARFHVGDVVEVVMPDPGAASRFDLAPGPEGAVVIIDVKTREVVALVGGYKIRAGGFNRAMQAKRQPGSSFKPFVYATAIATGRYTAASIVNDAPDVYDLWKPKNYGKCCEGPVRLRHALAQSINTVAIRVANDVTPSAVADTAHAMGIESDLPEHLSLSLGSGEVTPLELTNAFATFAAGGVYKPWRVVASIDGASQPEPEPTQAISPQVAYVVLDMMRSVVEDGTAKGAAKGLKIPLVGKTGTSNDERDAWFVGLTPEYAIGVWIGNDNNQPLGAKQTGGAIAAPVAVEVAKSLGNRGKHFERPSGVVEERIDKATGLLASPDADADKSYLEVFVEGTAPTEVAPLPDEVDTTTFVTGEYEDEEPPAAPVANP